MGCCGGGNYQNSNNRNENNDSNNCHGGRGFNFISIILIAGLVLLIAKAAL